MSRGRRGGRATVIQHKIHDAKCGDIRVRGTVDQVIEKLEAKAKEAAIEKDTVLEQTYLQGAEHYIRIRGEERRERTH